MKDKLKILILNEQANSLKHYLENMKKRGLNFEAELETSAQVAVHDYNPLNYNVLIVDSSDDIDVNIIGDEVKIFSEYWRGKNRKSLIIGTSVQYEMIKDKLSEKLYDETLCLRYQEFDEAIIQIFEKRKLFQEEAINK